MPRALCPWRAPSVYKCPHCGEAGISAAAGGPPDAAAFRLADVRGVLHTTVRPEPARRSRPRPISQGTGPERAKQSWEAVTKRSWTRSPRAVAAPPPAGRPTRGGRGRGGHPPSHAGGRRTLSPSLQSILSGRSHMPYGSHVRVGNLAMRRNQGARGRERRRPHHTSGVAPASYEIPSREAFPGAAFELRQRIGCWGVGRLPGGPGRSWRPAPQVPD